ncbi:hypothetical protein GCM10022631_24640 [Deinococcus rubellus]
MMVGIHQRAAGVGSAQLTVREKLYGVPEGRRATDLGVICPEARNLWEVLMERAAFEDIDELHAAADPEHRFSQDPNGPVKRVLKRVSLLVHFSQVTPGHLTIVLGMNVYAADQQHRVDPRCEVFGQFGQGRQEHRTATHVRDGLGVVTWRAVEPLGVTFGRAGRRQTNEGSGCHAPNCTKGVPPVVLP